MFPRVGIVILTHNGLRWIPKCLTSVAKTHYPNFETFVVDNGSKDGSAEYVEKHFPSVKLIRFPVNLGFARAYNESIRLVETEYVALLNQDTEVLARNWLQDLVKCIHGNPDVAAATCKMVSMQDHCILDSVGGVGVRYWIGFEDIGKYQLDNGQFRDDLEPFSFCGGASIVRRDLFLRLGGFDEKYFLYYEDVDLSWRFRLKGYHIRYVPRAVVGHYSPPVLGVNAEAKKFYHCHRNLLRMILKNCGPSLWWAIRNYLVYSFMLMISLVFQARQRWLSVIKALAWNLINLTDTCRSRLSVQASRLVGEEEILDLMYPSWHIRQLFHMPSQGLWKILKSR
jgi:GT2 family glycosyltransferase